MKKESQNSEYKKTFGKEVIISLVAFANTEGGRVYERKKHPLPRNYYLATTITPFISADLNPLIPLSMII
ncbi:MAG: ATP-binding protein [Proteobacteria bacterium]|nr:ATP-binding protein [Pseudomonadota bacterium]MBU1386734.1 ATP-binding protein [Pseudomonadota bacterium]MBU1544678.1 ATP-binding protein [Pseudomonadota bacterium]